LNPTDDIVEFLIATRPLDEVLAFVAARDEVRAIPPYPAEADTVPVTNNDERDTTPCSAKSSGFPILDWLDPALP